MRWSRPLKFLVVGMGLIALGTIGWKIYDFDRIDRCLDNGGSWHYDRSYCDFEVNYSGPVP